MTLYDTPDRDAVDRIKAAMLVSIDTTVAAKHAPWESGSSTRTEWAVQQELEHAIKMDLGNYRACPWESARLLAAYEIAAEHLMLVTFNRLWGEAERRGVFRSARLDPPVVTRTRGDDNADR